MKTTSINFRTREEVKELIATIATKEVRTTTQQVEYFVLRGLREYVNEHPEFADSLREIEG
jgi:hypothetical protein